MVQMGVAFDFPNPLAVLDSMMVKRHSVRHGSHRPIIALRLHMRLSGRPPRDQSIEKRLGRITICFASHC